ASDPADHRCGQPSPGRAAGGPRGAALAHDATHAGLGDLAHVRAAPGRGAGRRHRPRHPRHGARGHRHRHRWRDPARKPFEPRRFAPARTI
ncbi:MAG: 5-methyltetrahydropteroyltriglutamate--homocysteine methyltransferase, partial [uncultured Acetobacteraceae bacterium]